MALVFPRDLVSWARWRKAELTLLRRQELSREARGTTRAQDLGPTLWQADFESIALPLREAEVLEAEFDTLGGALRSFFVVPMLRRRPLTWAQEMLDNVTIAEIRADNAGLRLAGLPAGFILSAGDHLSITTGVGTEFHRLASGGTADAFGETPQLEVVPHVRPAVAPADPVRLVDPRVEMLLEPGSLSPRQVSKLKRSVGFRAIQVVR